MNEGCRDGSRGAGSDATIIPYFFIYVKSRYARSLAPCEMTGCDKRCLLAWLEENGDEQNRRPHRHLRRRRNATDQWQATDNTTSVPCILILTFGW